jgi:Mrp family chromosome partitioning ATPase
MHISDIPEVVLVASGKGGVGKTTVAADFALAAADAGHSVGFIDADISTPNSPEVVGGEGVDVSDQRLSDGESLVPPNVGGIQMVSQGLVLPDHIPVMRDAQWRAETVLEYMDLVEWDEGTDMVVVDSPPGSGAEVQTIAAKDAVTHAYVVTTPHPSSLRDATKTHEFFKDAGIPHETVLNMAYIPGRDIAEFVAEATAFSDIKGIGDAKSETIEKLMEEQVPDYRLFGYEGEVYLPFDSEVVAVIPYTENKMERKTQYDRIVDDRIGPAEVEQ